jgi:hypothetical protein
VSTISLGWIAVARDLLIFCPPTCSQPWAKTCRGTSTPAAISIAGQITAWKRRMSFPTRCTSAGQVRANICGSVPKPAAVA